MLLISCFVMLSCTSVCDALWSPAGKGLTSWLSFVLSAVSFHFPIGILGQVWYLIVSIPDLCTLTYFPHSLSLGLVDMLSYYGLCTVCLQFLLIKIMVKMKNTTQQPLKLKWTCPIDKSGKYHSA